jgi:hypothetical protein
MASRPWELSRRASPRRACRGPSSRRGSTARRCGRHHAGLADRHRRDLDQLRSPPGRRGRPEPGDDRAGQCQRGREPVPGLRRVDQRSRTAVAEQSGPRARSPGWWALVPWCSCCCSCTRCWPTCRRLPWRLSSSPAALSLMNFPKLRRLWRVRRTAWAVSLAATAGVVLFGVLQGILVAVALSILMFFRRNWWPHGVVLGRDETGPGTDGRPGRRSRSCRTSWSSAGRRRCSSPTRACSVRPCGHWSASRTPGGSSCSARR